MHNNKYRHDWTEVRINRLIQLWKDGWSANECARKLGGITRNSVIGKIHRLGLSNMERPQRENLRQRIVSVVKRRAKMEAAVNTANAVGDLRPEPVTPSYAQLRPEPPPASPTLLELRPGMCRYPQGDRVPYTFCGAPKVEGSSYCAEHKRLTESHGRAA